MDKGEFITELGKAQKAFNSLLMRAPQLCLRCELEIYNPKAKDHDSREVVGLKVFDTMPMYSNNGVP